MDPELDVLHEELERVDMTWKELLVLAVETAGPESGPAGFMNALGFDVNLAISLLRQLPDHAGPSAFLNRVSSEQLAANAATRPRAARLPSDASGSGSPLRRV